MNSHLFVRPGHEAFIKLNIFQDAQECDATGDATGNTAGSTKT